MNTGRIKKVFKVPRNFASVIFAVVSHDLPLRGKVVAVLFGMIWSLRLMKSSFQPWFPKPPTDLPCGLGWVFPSPHPPFFPPTINSGLCHCCDKKQVETTARKRHKIAKCQFFFCSVKFW